MEPVPSRADVEAKLLELIEGRLSPEDVSSWASEWIVRDFEDDLIDDLVVLRALERLSGADLGDFERPYLHDEADFRVWLDELREES